MIGISMHLHFTKIQATGNDFVVFDARNWSSNQEKDLMSSSVVGKMCHRRFGIGADGVLYLLNSNRADFCMRYFNADGAEVDMCGNGLRSLVSYYHKIGDAKSHYKIELPNDVYQAQVINGKVYVHMREKRDENKILIDDLPNGKINILSRYFVNTGVPHVVFQVDKVKDLNIRDLGRTVHDDSRFKIYKGVNVNFVEVLETNPDLKLYIRTFERGVEDETLSCGTGIVATYHAMRFNALSKAKGKLKTHIETLGGTLEIIDDVDHQQVWLGGDVQIVYHGQMDLI